MVDFTKHSHQWQQWMDVNKQACESIAKLTSDAFTKTMEEVNELGHTAKNLDPKKAQEIFELQAKFMQENSRRAMDYCQKLVKILVQTASTHGESFAAHAAECASHMGECSVGTKGKKKG